MKKWNELTIKGKNKRINKMFDNEPVQDNRLIELYNELQDCESFEKEDTINEIRSRAKGTNKKLYTKYFY